MNFAGVFRAIMERRMLTENSSLPVIVKKDNKLEVIWFTYRFEKREQEGMTRVSTVYSMADSNNIEEEEAVLEVPVIYRETEVPVLETKAYYGQLEKIYAHFDSKLMEKLLKKTVSEAFLPVYKAVIQYHLNAVELPDQEAEAQTDILENSRRGGQRKI